MWDKRGTLPVGRVREGRVLDWPAATAGPRGRHPVTLHINHLVTSTTERCLARAMANLFGDGLALRDKAHTYASLAGKQAWRKLHSELEESGGWVGSMCGSGKPPGSLLATTSPDVQFQIFINKIQSREKSACCV